LKIFCDWVIKNEEERIKASLESVLPYVDRAVVVDTGSTDKTLEIVKSVGSKHSNLVSVLHVDIGEHFDMSVARNTGLRACPPEFWKNEITWYMEVAGDEVYDESIRNLRATLEKLPDHVLWVYTWGRDWHINKETGERYIRNQKFGRPRLYRHIDGMYWMGVWNRERIVYPGYGSYFAYEQRNDEYRLYWDADVWYDHYGWADGKRHYRSRVYDELHKLEKKGVIPHPSL